MIKVLWFAPANSVSPGVDGQTPSDIYLLPASSRAELFAYLTNSQYDVLVAALPLPDCTPMEWMSELRRVDAHVPVILTQEAPSVADAVYWTKLGAYHVLPRSASGEAPFATMLFDTVRSAAMIAHGRPCVSKPTEPWSNFMVGNGLAMKRVGEVIRLIAARRSTVLITGETGTGKELAARAIHLASGRGDLPMVAVNCSAIPENLLEAELFGHVKGAFTGATQNRVGRFEQANGSTIFLDEIGDMPLDLQAKLLRVLQEREIQRVGSSETTRLDLRVVAATNLDLETEVRAKRFRQDLYYRLNVVPIRLPSLRERREDIPQLVQHFVEKICTAEGLPDKTVSRETMAVLAEQDWPGNVRQLEHTVEMAVVLSGNRETLFPTDFAVASPQTMPVSSGIGSPFIQLPDEGFDFDAIVSRVERSIMEQALAKSNGNKARAADLLRMKRTTLLAKMKALQPETVAAEAAVA